MRMQTQPGCRQQYPRFPLLPMIKMLGLCDGIAAWWEDQVLGNKFDREQGFLPIITFR